ncbi:YcjF family protein [Quisquiliibacterium transsilvanicum]
MRTSFPTTSAMNHEQQKAILAISILAAFADGSKADSERDEVRRVAETLGSDGDMQAMLRDVLLKRIDLAWAIDRLPEPELRQLAYELAVGVCEADGLRNADETRFLSELARALGLGAREAAAPIEDGDALASLPLEAGAEPEVQAGATAAPAATGAAAPPGPVVAATPRRPESEIDSMIVNYAILNGALELLPQSTASMAIIPLQMKMVYRIGKDYGYELDRGHVRDLLAAMGVGLTGQYLEEIGRKLVGGLFGKAAGRMIGGLARGATGMAFSFATTWALGQVARRYYAGGRVMSAQVLKDTYAQTLGQAKSLQSQYLPQIEQKARTIDVGQIVAMVRNQ